MRAYISFVGNSSELGELDMGKAVCCAVLKRARGFSC